MNFCLVFLLCSLPLFGMQRSKSNILPFSKATAVPEGAKDTIEWDKISLKPEITFGDDDRCTCKGVYASGEGIFGLEFFDQTHPTKKYNYSFVEALQVWKLDESISNIHVYGVARISKHFYVAVLLAQEKEPDDVFAHIRCDMEKQSGLWYIKSTAGHYRDIKLFINSKNNFKFKMLVEENNKKFQSYSIYNEAGQISRFDMMPIEEKRYLSRELINSCNSVTKKYTLTETSNI